jgi:hypothetical protein
MFAYLKQPYQDNSTIAGKLRLVFLIGIFIFLFLFLFKPFGFGQISPINQLLISLGYGLITSFVVFVFAFLLDPVVTRKKNWTVGKNILWDMVMVSSIGIANFIFFMVIFLGDFKLQNLGLYFKYLLFSVWSALLIGAIPATITYLLYFNKRNREILERLARSAEVPELWEERVDIKAGNSRNSYTFNPKSIVYISSNDNYVCVAALKGDSLHKTHIRGTLKAIENELAGNNQFIRCHKCFIVNAKYIDRVVGNAQGMRLILSVQGVEIPVSRSSAPDMAKRFRGS